MSMQPNNPFETNPADPSFQEAPKKSKGWLWVLGIFGGLGLVGLVVCCGVGYWVWGVATGFLAEAYTEQLTGNPVMAEHIGEDFTLEMNLMRTGKEQQETGDDSVQAFDVSGSNGSGTLVVKPDASAPGEILSAELVLPDGTRHDVPINLSDVMEDLELDIDEGDDPGGVEVPAPEVETVP